jgi:hypothetical protein
MRVPCPEPGCTGDSALVRDPLCALHRKQRRHRTAQRQNAYKLCRVCNERTVYASGLCYTHHKTRPRPLDLKPRAERTPMGVPVKLHSVRLDSHSSMTMSVDDEEEEDAAPAGGGAQARGLVRGAGSGGDDVSSLDEADCFHGSYAPPGFQAVPSIHAS